MAMYPRRKLYPENWPEIAGAIKESANWICQHCGQQCYRPGERVQDWRRVLTVAHLDRDPAHNESDNLRALCVVCHLNYDRVVNVRAARRTRFLKRAGPMLPLPWLVQES